MVEGDAQAAFDALIVLVDPWLYGSEREAISRLMPLAPIDWPLVLALAARHRVTPLLAERVKATELERHSLLSPPKQHRDLLRQQCQAALVSEMSTLAELRRIKALFDAREIAFLVFKGLTLSSACFGRLGLRINRDIDILVSPSEVLRGHAALIDGGYERIAPVADAASVDADRSLLRTKDWVYRKADPPSIVELHHRLLDNATLCDPSVAARARKVELFGQIEVAALAGEDELAYLAQHGAMHAWSRLKWLLDVAILMRDMRDEELATILRKARGGPAAAALHQAISLCWKTFCIPRPEPRGDRPWATGLLTRAAVHSLRGHGASEIENTRFGTTIKNLSHYLLWNHPAYWLAELKFDLGDTSQDANHRLKIFPIWLHRALAWLGRRCRRRPVIGL